MRCHSVARRFYRSARTGSLNNTQEGGCLKLALDFCGIWAHNESAFRKRFHYVKSKSSCQAEILPQ